MSLEAAHPQGVILNKALNFLSLIFFIRRTEMIILCISHRVSWGT